MTKDEISNHLEKAKRKISIHKKAISDISKKFRNGPGAKYAAALKASKKERHKKYNDSAKKGPGCIWTLRSVGRVYGVGGVYDLRYPTSYHTNETWWGHNGTKAKAFPNSERHGDTWLSPQQAARKYANAGLPKPKPVKDEKCLLKEEIAKLRKDIAKLGKKK